MTLTYRARLMRKSAMEPGEEGPHPRLLRTLLRKRQKKRGGIKKQQQTARRKAKRRVTRLCLAADAALMRRNHSFISCHLWEITTMAAAGCRWSRRDIRSRKKKQLWEDEDQNRVWPTFRGADSFIRELGKKNKQSCGWLETLMKTAKSFSQCHSTVEAQFPPIDTNLLLVTSEWFFWSHLI